MLCAIVLGMTITKQKIITEKIKTSEKKTQQRCRNFLFCVETFSSGAKTPKYLFHRNFNLKKIQKTWKMANNFTLLHSLHLLLSTSFCLHVSLKRNINFVHEISHVEYNAFIKFSARNTFGRKRNDNNFHTNYLEN